MGVVVDENVVIEAATGKKPDGKEAWSEAEFMCGLFRSPEKIFVNDAILKKFSSMEGKIKAAAAAENCNNLIYKGLAALLKDSGRTVYVDGTRVDHEGLKKCDKEFVGVAVQSGAILVTADERLRAIVAELRGRGTDVECLGADAALGRIGPHAGSQAGQGGRQGRRRRRGAR